MVFLSGQFSDFFQRSTFYRGVVLPRGLLHRRVSLDLGERAASFRRAGAHPRNGPTLHVLRCFSYRLLPTNNGCGQSSCSTSYDIRQYVVMFMNVCVCVCHSIVQIYVVCCKCKSSPSDLTSKYFLLYVCISLTGLHVMFMNMG